MNEHNATASSPRKSRWTSSALTAFLVSFALASSLLIREHAAATAPTSNELSYNISLSTPAGWNSWVPVSTTAEPRPDTIFEPVPGIVKFTATTDATVDTAAVRFHLSDVTSYEGRYMNDMTRTENYDADVYFAPAYQQDRLYHGRIWWEGGGKNSTTITALWAGKRPVKTPIDIVIPVKVVCDDYAAYAKIKATLHANNKTKDSETHTIPKDNNDNKVADAWEGQYTINFTPARLLLDRDAPLPNGNPDPHGVNTGDGFTALEEYRGFFVGGSHTRLNPFDQKDLFIHSKLSPTLPPLLPVSIMSHGTTQALPAALIWRCARLIRKSGMTTLTRRITGS